MLCDMPTVATLVPTIDVEIPVMLCEVPITEVLVPVIVVDTPVKPV